MDGLLGGQTQGQQQANLLGGVFQTPSNTRRQERNSLLGNAVQISQMADPFAASIAMGATDIGLGIGRALGFETQGDQTARVLQQVQQETLDRGLDPTTDPEGTFNFISERFRQLGNPQLALQAQQQKIDYIRQLREIAPELPAEAQNLAFRAKQAGLEEGTEEYRQFMLRGGELPEQEGVEVKSSARYRDKQTDETLTLVRTDKGLARQTIGPDGQPQYQYVSGDRYERISAQEAGQPGSFEADFSDLASRRNVTLSFIEQADELASQITPETVGLPGAVARGLSSLSSQIQGSFRAAFGSRLEAPTDVSSYTDTFENLGLSEESAEVQSALIDLAVTKAYLDQGGTGDVRKNEVERALQTIRAGSGDPQQIRAALGRLRERAARDFNIALDTATRQSSAEAPFGPITLEDIRTQPEPTGGMDSDLTVDSVSTMSLSELQSLAQDEQNFPTDAAVIQAIDDRLNQLITPLDRENRRRGTGAR